MQKLVFKNANGIELDLTSDPFGITEWEGFSANDLNIQSQQVPFQDGAVFLDALLEERELVVTVAMNDRNNLETRYRLRREMIAALNPKLGEGILIYTNDYLSKQIHVIPQLPVFENHNSNDSGTPKVSCSFTACNPYWEDLQDTTVDINLDEVKNIENEGDIPAQVKVEMFASGAVNPTIQNINTKKIIKYEGELKNNLFINTNAGHKEVLLEKINCNFIDYNPDLTSICYSKFLCMFLTCIGGIEWYSYDGEIWNIYSMMDVLGSTIISIDEKNFLILLSSRKIYISKDGFSWELRILSIFDDFMPSYYCYSAELDLYIAVGHALDDNYTPMIASSPDFENWTIRYNTTISGDQMYPRFVIYIEELHKFYGGGYNGVIWSSPDGINWSYVDLAGGSIQKIYYSNELQLLIALELSNSRIYVSSDGINWTLKTEYQSSGYAYDFIYNDVLQKFIFLGSSGKIYVTQDLENFTQITIEDLSGTPRSIAYNQDTGKMAMVGSYGQILVNNNDAATWVRKHGESNSVYYHDILYSEKYKKYVMVDGIGNVLYGDINSWQSINLGTTYASQSIRYIQEKDEFIVCNRNYIYRSTDLETWEAIGNIGVGNITFQDICYSAELHKYVLINYLGDYVYVSEDNLNSWTRISLNTPSGMQYLLRVIYDVISHKFLITGSRNLFASSSDGLNWNVQTIGDSQVNTLYDIMYSPVLQEYIIVGGYNNQFFTSRDLITWDFISTIYSLTEQFCQIMYLEKYKLFILADREGGVFTTFDGVSFYRFPSTAGATSRFTYNSEKDELVFVGINGCMFKITFEYIINEISKLSADSDIGFNLAIGNNQLRLVKDSGTFSAKITYRQKYIGV